VRRRKVGSINSPNRRELIIECRICNIQMLTRCSALFSAAKWEPHFKERRLPATGLINRRSETPLPDPLLALIDRNNLLASGLADVLAQRAVKPIVFQLFEDVCAPSGTTGNRKNRGEEISRNT